MSNILDNELFEAFARASDKIYIYVSNMETGVTRWSKAAVEYFALPDEFMHNMGAVWTEYIHPEDRESYVVDISAVINGTSESHNCQYRARNRYGEYVWVECKGSVIKNAQGAPTVFAGIMTRLDDQSKYDPITHLLSSYELARNEVNDDGAIMVVGIDGLRKFNSQYGFTYGNEILRYFAQLLENKSAGTINYRFIGDEFLLRGKDMKASDMEAIYEELKKECSIVDKSNGITAFGVTAGVLEYSGDEELVDVLARAEVCYDYAKENYLGECVIYSEEIEKKVNRKNLVSENLLACIKNDFEGFRLVYQPILANTGDTVIACEALLRWNSNNDQIGNCYPDEFISILEKNGGMEQVGYFVMREAIKQASIWQKKYKDFNVTFNVSYVQLEDEKFVPAIIETIDEYGADPKRIVVELTESILNVDTVKVKQSFEILRQKGIMIALDDFGTGNSSFWMLHNIDVDIVKLDQSFIRKLDSEETGIDRAIVESVGIMCNRIGFKTVAEGIENETIWKMVSDYGFSGLQGYLFSKPIEVADFELLLDKYDMKL